MEGTLTRLMAAACLIVAATPAHAASWYMLDGSEGSCLSGAEAAKRFNSPEPLTPRFMERSLREAGDFARTNITRGANGAIESVEIVNQHGMGVDFFVNRQVCEARRDELLHSGAMTKPDELK